MNNKVDILKELKRHEKMVKKSISKLIETIYNCKMNPEESFSFKNEYIKEDPYICVKSLGIVYIKFIISKCSVIDSFLEETKTNDFNKCKIIFDKIYKGYPENYKKFKKCNLEKVKEEMSKYQKIDTLCSLDTFWEYYHDIRIKIIQYFYTLYSDLKKVNNCLENIFGEHFEGINKWLSLGENPMHNLSVETTWEYISKNDIIFSAFCITKNKLDEAELSENVSKFEKDISKIQKILNSFYQLINLTPIPISSNIKDVSYYNNYNYNFDLQSLENYLYCFQKETFINRSMEVTIENIKKEEEKKSKAIKENISINVEDLINYINEDDADKKKNKKKKNKKKKDMLISDNISNTNCSNNLEEELSNTAISLVNNAINAVFDKDIEDFKLIWSNHRNDKFIQKIIPNFTNDWLNKIKVLGDKWK